MFLKPYPYLLLLCFVFSVCSERIVQISEICSKHSNIDNCNKILLSVPGTSEGADLGSLTSYIINMAHVNAYNSHALISEIIGNTSDAQAKQRYNSCSMDYNDALLSLTQAKQSYSSGNFADVKSNGAVVIKDVQDCDTKAYDSSLLRTENQYLVDLSTIIMILADFLAGKF
ncbi:hypothetical protein VNO78_16525 [Psophocarpus tetragonolobus]|uniref:Pectinesterase inhibitor domain-containing protein n=1 Tax=Psophocarpus tetragonolobus TaxID=3891 RepID=A0AAN9SGY1_PSOTE